MDIMDRPWRSRSSLPTLWRNALRDGDLLPRSDHRHLHSKLCWLLCSSRVNLSRTHRESAQTAARMAKEGWAAGEVPQARPFSVGPPPSRVGRRRGTNRPSWPFSVGPPPNWACELSPHPALQCLHTTRVDRQGVAALGIPPTSRPANHRHLPPFALWTALPSADYYGGSVADRARAP